MWRQHGSGSDVSRELMPGFDAEVKRRRKITLQRLVEWDCGYEQFPHKVLSRCRMRTHIGEACVQAAELASYGIERTLNVDVLPEQVGKWIRSAAPVTVWFMANPSPFHSPLNTYTCDFLLAADDVVLSGILGCTHPRTEIEQLPRNHESITCLDCGLAAMKDTP